MQIKEGYLYNVSDDFFKLVDDLNLPVNHGGFHSRPSYYLIKTNDLLWFIPLSTKVQKYRMIYNKKVKKYGYCNTIIFTNIASKPNAILIQNAFPTLPKFIKSAYTVNSKPYKMPTRLQAEIKSKFNQTMALYKNKNINLFFTDIKKIETIMYQELSKETGKKYGLIDVSNRALKLEDIISILEKHEKESIFDILSDNVIDNQEIRLKIDEITHYQCKDINYVNLEILSNKIAPILECV